jgi:hypothetical protein
VLERTVTPGIGVRTIVALWTGAINLTRVPVRVLHINVIEQKYFSRFYYVKVVFYNWIKCECAGFSG